MNKQLSKSIFRSISMIAALVFLFSLSGCVSAQNKDCSAIQLTIYHQNDFHGYKPDNLARIATLVKQARKRGENVLFLNAGDLFTRGRYHYKYFGELEFAQLNVMDLDAFTLGNNEFKATSSPETSQKILFDLTRQAVYPVLCANITFSDTGEYLPNIHPFTVLKLYNLRIGIMGLTADRVASYPQAKGLTVTPALACAEDVFTQLDSESDIQIALTHIGYEEDLKLAGMLPELEAIVGGDSHTLLSQPTDVAGIPIVQAGGEQQQYLGRLVLNLIRNASGQWELSSYTGELIKLDKTIKQDPETLEVMQSILSVPVN